MARIIVIGGGASGMMAAGQAALAGREVLLLEKTARCGNKLRISGRGRCNLTNRTSAADFIAHFNRPGRFLRQPFSRFFVPELERFFKELGVPLECERGGRVFPRSGRAAEVVDALVAWLAAVGVETRPESPVEALVVRRQRLVGVRCRSGELACAAAILACGGASYPTTGSTGDGCRLAAACGHSLTPLRPALVPLTVKSPPVAALAGLDLKNIGLRLYIDGRRKVNAFGEIGFNRNGIGGPLTLTHSRLAVDSLEAGRRVTAAIDLKPALDEHKLDRRLRRDFEQRSREPLDSVLRGLLPKPLVPFCLQHCRLDGTQPSGRVGAAERRRLRSWLKDFRLEIDGHRPLDEAIVTAGGVKVTEVDPNTMASKIVPGLYLCGELLDLDADTGGYNLQAAFSTGWLAGRSAAAAVKAPATE